jgi:hypothetical protein
MNNKTKPFNLHDITSALPENLREVLSQVHGPSFAKGGAVGTAAGVAVTILVKHLNDRGALEPVSDFIDYVRAYGGNVAVVEVPGGGLGADDDFEVIEVDAEVIDDSAKGAEVS